MLNTAMPDWTELIELTSNQLDRFSLSGHRRINFPMLTAIGRPDWMRETLHWV